MELGTYTFPNGENMTERIGKMGTYGMGKELSTWSDGKFSSRI